MTRVIVDLSDYETPYDLPFPPLGCLSAYVQDYKDLDSGDYRSGDLGALIEEWCDFDDLDTPTDSPGFRSALQQEVGEGTLQFRLQFADGETDGDSRNDLLRWPFDNLPRMSVEYQTSQK